MIVRFRIDTPDGQRSLTHEKVCQVANGKSTLSLAEQRRRAPEIVEAAGVNNTTQIKQSVLGLMFAEQAEKFFEVLKNPPPPPRQHQYRLHMAHHSGQVAASEPWRDVTSRCEQPSRQGTRREDGEGKAGGKSIDNDIGLVKLIVASAIDENGEEIYPRKWNHEFIDLPEVKNQHKPSFTAEQVPDIIARAKGQSACCFSW